MLSTPFVNSNVDLLRSKDKYDIYLKLSDFSNSLQVYAKKNHVDDATNAKPSNDANAEAFDVTAISFL
jgi:hypothetical protein